MAPPEGARLLDRTSGEVMLHLNGAWEAGVVWAREVRVGGQAVLAERQAPIEAPSGGALIDAEGWTAISAILSALRAHGLIGI